MSDAPTTPASEETVNAALIGCTDGLGVRSGMVRCYHTEVLRCPKCGLLPVEVSIMSTALNRWHRFECPGECSQKPPRYRPSHAEAADEWNKLSSPLQPPTSRLETDGRASSEGVAAGEARTPNAPHEPRGAKTKN